MDGRLRARSQTHAHHGTGHDLILRPIGFPEDFQESAVRRLGYLSLIYGGAYLTAYSVGLLVSPDLLPMRQHLSIFDIVAIVSITASFVMYGLVRLSMAGRLDSSLTLDLGLLFEVLGSFAIAINDHWQPWLPDHPARGISYICVWIVIFPLIVPSTLRKTFLAAFTSASMGPLALMITVLRGNPAPTFDFCVLLFIANYLCVGVAILPSYLIRKLGQDAKRAREMGSYRLTECLGRGGMGEVWKAEHWMLARPSAVKIVRPDALGANDKESRDRMLKRFEREAQATASMCSPHTIALYDFGVSDDGMFYYVMELLDGLDVESLVQRFGPVPPERAVHFLRQVCDSLAEAHDQGLIHRDIKPANVYVCRYGRQDDFIKVLDFGLVKWRAESGEANLDLTVDNVATGTPAYMAPEQILGNRPMDARTDIYAVGCVAYWLLTCHPVFETESAVTTMVHHVQTPPIPPSERSEQEIPESLERIILSCLEKDPDRRPQSADALSDGLAACTRHQLWTPERARRWWDTHLPRASSGNVNRSQRA